MRKMMRLGGQKLPRTFSIRIICCCDMKLNQIVFSMPTKSQDFIFPRPFYSWQPPQQVMDFSLRLWSINRYFFIDLYSKFLTLYFRNMSGGNWIHTYIEVGVWVWTHLYSWFEASRDKCRAQGHSHIEDQLIFKHGAILPRYMYL
jgi:hypothetical protein